MKSLVILILCAVTLVAEDQVQFQPGVLAKVYACGAFQGELDWHMYKDTSNLWPIKTLPDSPGEILRLKDLPTVEATSLTELYKGSLPSYLVSCKTALLRGNNFYAVEFEGYLLAPLEGIYTIVMTCDDPVEVFIEGRTVLTSTFSVSPEFGPTIEGQQHQPSVQVKDEADPQLIAEVVTVQSSMRLSPNKYYHLVVVCRQRWLPATQVFLPYHAEWQTSNLNRGAVFRATITTPDGKSGPLALQLPVIAKTAP